MTGPFRTILRLLARPARTDHGRGGIVIMPYRGYGSRQDVFLMGRVFRQPSFGDSARSGLWQDLADLLRRFLRRGIGDAAVVARFCGTEQRVATDRDGYFRLTLHPAVPPPSDRVWHDVALELADGDGQPTRVTASVFVPPIQARHVVISDIDDTVMFTGVANKLAMMWRLFFQGAKSRTAFPGISAFYRALHSGPSGQDGNPILYVSRGPWSLYEVLDRFFNMHRIPVGPILFLREWGLTLQRPLPKRAKHHKRDLIRTMLSLYDGMPFVLIGDSGQHDPEIYAEIVREFPGRVQAIYIRNVSRKAARDDEIRALARRVVEQQSTLLLASDSQAMAEHAAEHGLISADALPEIAGERQVEEAKAAGQPAEDAHPAPAKPRRQVDGATRDGTLQAVDQGKVEQALHEAEDADGVPGTVEVGQRPAGGA